MRNFTIEQSEVELPAQVEGSRNIDWLRRNARNYSGKWVALADGTFLAADESLD